MPSIDVFVEHDARGKSYRVVGPGRDVDEEVKLLLREHPGARVERKTPRLDLTVEVVVRLQA